VTLMALVDFAVGAVIIADHTPRYTGTYADGTINFKPQCATLARHLLKVAHQRPDQPMENDLFRGIKERIEACNAAH
jgi:hypothetical protein